MNATNIVELDLSNNPALADIFAGKEIGDDCEFTVHLKIKEIDDKKVVGGITKIESDYDGGEEKEAEPTPEEPLRMTIGPAKELYPDAA